MDEQETSLEKLKDRCSGNILNLDYLYKRADKEDVKETILEHLVVNVCSYHQVSMNLQFRRLINKFLMEMDKGSISNYDDLLESIYQGMNEKLRMKRPIIIFVPDKKESSSSPYDQEKRSLSDEWKKIIEQYPRCMFGKDNVKKIYKIYSLSNLTCVQSAKLRPISHFVERIAGLKAGNFFDGFIDYTKKLDVSLDGWETLLSECIKQRDKTCHEGHVEKHSVGYSDIMRIFVVADTLYKFMVDYIYDIQKDKFAGAI